MFLIVIIFFIKENVDGWKDLGKKLANAKFTRDVLPFNV